MKIDIPVSIGELLDNISIINIKVSFVESESVTQELEDLKKIRDLLIQGTLEYEIRLRVINEKLWKIEDRIREKEKLKEFDDEFIELARSVYKTNDERVLIKREINEVYNSPYQEVKSYLHNKLNTL